jgi:hypothetical protein
MRKLALLVFLLTNLGGVAMAAPMHAAPSFARRATPAERGTPARQRGVVPCPDIALAWDVHIDAFARVPQLDGSNQDFPIAFAGVENADPDAINQELMRGFEQVLNQESARQGRTVDALLAHGAALGNRDDASHVALYTFNLDAELRIVRAAYLLRTQPTRA